MRSLDPDPESTCLAGKVTIGRYREMVQGQDRIGIANLIQKRFEERYLDAILYGPKRHGFAMLAVCCLMVEALESFRHGWPHTDRKSEAAFCSFFQAHEEFHALRPVAHEFYRAVRCGILHQAETVDGWRVHRGKGLLLQQDGVHWVSAREFAERLKTVLHDYCDVLRRSDWGSPAWTAARAKLHSICKNSGAGNLSHLK